MVLDITLNLFTWILFVTITTVYNLIWMPKISWGPMVWGPILTILDNPPRIMLNKVRKWQESSLKSSKVNFILVRVAFTYLKPAFLYGNLSSNVLHEKSFFIIFLYLPSKLRNTPWSYCKAIVCQTELFFESWSLFNHDFSWRKLDERQLCENKDLTYVGKCYSSYFCVMGSKLAWGALF